MDTRGLGLAVALAPAAAAAMLALWVLGHAIRRKCKGRWLSAQRLELLRELLVHAAFYGTIASTLLGVPASHWTGRLASAVWVIVVLASAAVATRKLELIERDHARKEREVLQHWLVQVLQGRPTGSSPPNSTGALETAPTQPHNDRHGSSDHV